MKKLFISQPMKGKTDEQILKERHNIINKVKKEVNEDIILIDSFLTDVPENAKPLWYLGKSLELMSEADIVAFASGFEKYRGCKIEHECALSYEIPILIYC